MKRIICFGDSITAASKAHEGGRWTHHLHHALTEKEEGWEVYNRGVGGNTTWQALDRFEADVFPWLPAYVLIEFGFNDASVPWKRQIPRCSQEAFCENLAEIARLVRVGGGKPIFIVNHPIQEQEEHQSNGKSYYANFLPYQGLIRKVAHETNTPSIDLEKAMLDGKVDLNVLLSDDKLHLSNKGNQIYAEYLFPLLWKWIR